VIRSVRWLALAFLLCAQQAAGEQEAVRLPVSEAELTSALPEVVKEPARDAVRRVERVSQRAGGGGPFSLGAFDRKAPVVIRADELEATERDGRRVLVFRNRVEVQQGGLMLRAESLSAVYPPDSKQPSRLEAEGDVVVSEGQREARCDRAVYDRLEQRLDCIGHASLRDGDDRVAGKSIRFDLARRSVRIEGGTELWFEPSEEAKSEDDHVKGLPGMPWLRSELPASVRSGQLEATDDAEGRRITFDGDVEVSQQGATLRAQRLEAVYPPGAQQPDRMLASGGVSLSEGARQARCETAEYLRVENRVRCHFGVAEQGGDRLEGDLIDFALGAETLSLRGNTRLVLAPRETEGARP
jgi:lipopolysaccharide export system protein LptA